MLCSPTQTCFWAGRLTPAIRAMRGSPTGWSAGNGGNRRSEHEILTGSRVWWKPTAPQCHRPGMGSVPMLRRRIRTGRPGPPPPGPAHYSGARKARNHPRAGPPQESPIVPGEAVLRAGVNSSPSWLGRGRVAPAHASGTSGSLGATRPCSFPTLRGRDSTPDGAGMPPQRPRAPPFRFAFFSRLSYWCDIRWAWIWAMKSITTTTTISSEVPPK